MVEKQNTDSLVNAQDNVEWVKTETQNQVSATPVHPPIHTEVPVAHILVKQEALPYESDPVYTQSPGFLLDQYRRKRQTEINMLLFASSICAYLAFFNVIDFFYMDLQKAEPMKIAFVALKTAIGLFGAIMLPTQKFTAIRVYALAFVLVYVCFAGFFLHNVFAHPQETKEDKCAPYKSFYDRNSAKYSWCLANAMNMLVARGVLMVVFGAFGGWVALAYARKAMKFIKSEQERVATEETEAV